LHLQYTDIFDDGVTCVFYADDVKLCTMMLWTKLDHWSND